MGHRRTLAVLVLVAGTMNATGILDGAEPAPEAQTHSPSLKTASQEPFAPMPKRCSTSCTTTPAKIDSTPLLLEVLASCMNTTNG